MAEQFGPFPPFGLRFLRRLPEPRAARAGAQGNPYEAGFKQNVKLDESWRP
jgi:hypothetical protein